MGSSGVAGTQMQYLDQLAQAEIEAHVYPIDPSFTHLNSGGYIGMKPMFWRPMLEKFGHYGRIVFSDAHDITFYGTKAEVISKIPTDYALQAAERVPYPDKTLMGKVEGTTPWRFVNGGLTAGTPQKLSDWMDAFEKHPMYSPDQNDQAFFNRLLLEGSPLCRVDTTTELFFCLSGGNPELARDGDRLLNTFCNTRPNFIHANGRSSLCLA